MEETNSAGPQQLRTCSGGVSLVHSTVVASHLHGRTHIRVLISLSSNVGFCGYALLELSRNAVNTWAIVWPVLISSRTTHLLLIPSQRNNCLYRPWSKPTWLPFNSSCNYVWLADGVVTLQCHRVPKTYVMHIQIHLIYYAGVQWPPSYPIQCVVISEV